VVSLKQIEKQIENFVPKMKDDVFAVEVIKEAIKSAKEGNFGVGAILVDKKGKIIYRGHNQVFSAGRSDFHSEMDVMNKLETEHNRGAKRKKLIESSKIYTSLESCPMCWCRMVTAGIMEVYHIADDDFGGIVNIKNQLPYGWKELAYGRVFTKAECSRELSSIAETLFLLTKDLNDKL